MLHIPILRRGEPYRSLEAARAVHYRTREPFVEVSQANVGLIRRDLRGQAEARAALAKFTVEELLALCARAAEHFASDALPLGDSTQTPEDYVRQVTATTGMPHVLVRRNMVEDSRRAGRDGGRAGRADARPRPEGARRGLWRAGRTGAQLLSARGVARRRAAEQLAGRPRAVDARSRAEDAARPEARGGRAVDAVPFDRGVRARGAAARGVRLLPDRPCGRGRDPRTVRARDDVRRRLVGRRVEGRSAR